VTPDFDGDGYADVAIGIPNERVDGALAAGAVAVLYGSRTGLDAARNQLWSHASPGIPGQAVARDLFGFAIATGDVDGDGRDELAIGARYDDEGAVNGGGVVIIRGSPSGLTAVGSQRWDQDQPGMADSSERAEQFGWSLVIADFNGDGRGDLAIGNRYEDINGAGSGAVQVLYGSGAGLSAAGSQAWSQDSPGVADRSEPNDQFGRTMASGDFDDDGFEDLAISAPYESHHGNRTGRVHVLHGSRRGLTAAGSQVWDQDAPGVLEQADLRDEFGLSLAAGDFDGDGSDDLAVGVWFEDQCWICNEGGVAVLDGSRSGLRAAGNQFWTQDSPGVADHADVGDQFGQALVAGDMDGDNVDDLVVGIPWEDFNDRNVFQDRGAIAVLYGSRRGLTGERDGWLQQGGAGIGERGGNHDHFGESLGAADVDGDGDADLIVGVPWEDLDRGDEGVVHVIFGSLDGVGAEGDQIWSQDSLGILGSADRGDRFGWSVSSSQPRTGTPRSCGGRDGGAC